MEIFRDRRDAGRRLAEAIRNRVSPSLVVGIARGGMVIAEEVVRVLGTRLDVVVTKKVGHPDVPEFAIGAVAPGSVRFTDFELIGRAGISVDRFHALADIEETELTRRMLAYRNGLESVPVLGRSVLVVDDGIVTGLTALAAVRFLHEEGAAEVIVAAPVASAEGLDCLHCAVDDSVALIEPSPFNSIGRWYEQFARVEDEEVIAILNRANQARSVLQARLLEG